MISRVKEASWNHVLGILLLSYAILDVALILMYGSPHSLGWLSNSAGFVLAGALLYGSRWLAVLVSAMSFTGEGVWTVDFFSGALFGWFPFEATNYAFVPGYPIQLIIAAMIHVVLWFAAAVTLYKWGTDWPSLTRREWAVFVSFVAYLGLMSYWLPWEKNINCLHESCIRFIPTFPGYLFGYVAGYMLMTLIVLCVFVFPRTHQLMQGKR